MNSKSMRSFRSYVCFPALIILLALFRPQFAKSGPPGHTLVADGSVNPNDIPDDVAIRHFLLRLSAMYDRDAGNMSHEAATEFTLSVAQHTKAGADLLAFLDPYVTEFRSLNNDALATKDVSVLKALAEKRQQLFKHLLSDVDTRLDATLKGLVHVYLQTQVKPNIKIYR